MRDVIQKVMTTEDEAQRLLQAARVEAEEIISQARQQAREQARLAQQQSRQEAAEIIRAAIAQAEQDKSRQLAHAAREINQSIQLDESTARQCVEAALKTIRGDAHERPIIL